MSKEKRILIHHHIGLGDHFVCNAIVRKSCELLKEKQSSIYLVVKEKNLPTVSALYSQNNINFLKVKDDFDAVLKYEDFEYRMRIGFGNCDVNDWERSFYNQAKMHYAERFMGSFTPRNTEREDSLFQEINPPEKYAFCNFKCGDGEITPQAKTNLPQIFLSEKTDNLLDWCKIIENAEEIHTIDSSVFQLVKNMNLPQDKFFYDTRGLIRNRTPFSLKGNKNWRTIVP